MRNNKRFPGTKLSALRATLGAFLIFGSATALAQEVSVIGAWPLATDAKDTVGQNHGKLKNGAEFVDGCLKLDGKGAHVNFGPELSVPSSMSFALWFNCATDAQRFMRVLGKFKVQDNMREYCAFLDDKRVLYVFLSGTGTELAQDAILQRSIDPIIGKTNEWHHLAVTWNAAEQARGLHVYVDGVEVATATASAGAIDTLHAGSADLTLGAYDVLADKGHEIATNSFQGSLSQLILCDGCLTDDDIAALYVAGRAGDPSQIIEETAHPRGVQAGKTPRTPIIGAVAEPVAGMDADLAMAPPAPGADIATLLADGAQAFAGPLGAQGGPADFSTWLYSCPLAFSGYTRSEVLTNFPVLVSMGTNISDFAWSQFACATNGFELRFSDATGTQELNYEFDSGTSTLWTNSAGIGLVWVQVPVLTNGATIIAYWGNAAQTTSRQAYTTNGAAWSNGFEAVWHFNETASPYRDSVNKHNATAGTIPSRTNDAIAGYAQSFNGSKYLNVSGTVTLGDKFCLSAWGKVASGASSCQGILASKSSSTNSTGFGFNVNSVGTSDKRLVLFTGNGSKSTAALTSSNVVTYSSWHHMATLVSRLGSNVTLCVDGANRTSSGTIVTNFGNASVYLGQFSGNSYRFNGILDEVRIETAQRSTNWVWAEWLNVASNGAFQSWGAISSNCQPVAVLAADPTNGVAPLTVNFDGSASYDADADPLSYAWTFGDGGTSNGATVAHVYTNAGVYTATLTVDDGRGGSGVASVSIGVPVSTPLFSPDGGKSATAPTVTISCDTFGATIRYTLDGSDPTTNSTVITNGCTVTIDRAKTLKAKAWKSGCTASDVKTANYIVTGAVAAGAEDSLAVRSDGTVWAWGWNQYGQLGDGSAIDRYTPQQVSGLGGVTAISCGNYHSAALTTAGGVFTWGKNQYGQLGDNTTITRYSPITVAYSPMGQTVMSAVAAGGFHTLALDNTGHVWTWGWNQYGQLGNGSSTDQHAPIQVGDLANVVAIAAGACHSLAVDNAGHVWTWGWNRYGQLGIGSTTDQSSPVMINGLNNIVAVSAGSGHSLALDASGHLWSWGWNQYGQLGDGSTNDALNPTQIPGVDAVAVVSAGFAHSLALTTNGSVQAWGWNGFGQIGDGTLLDRCAPVQLTTLTNMMAIAAGTYHSLAIGSNGLVQAWGSNQHGELGDGTNLQHIAPGPAGTFRVLWWDDPDQDGLPTWWELANGLNPDSPSDAQMDFDADALTNAQEYQYGTNPNRTIDTDGDGIPDDWEIVLGLNPYDSLDALDDPDGDGFPTIYEYMHGSDPFSSASKPTYQAGSLDILVTNLTIDAIQYAVVNLATQNYAIVWLSSGTYSRSSSPSNLTLTFGKKVMVTGSSGDPANTTLDCSPIHAGADPYVFYYTSIKFASNDTRATVLRGVTITNPRVSTLVNGSVYSANGNCGVYCQNASPTITNCRFNNCSGYAIDMYTWYGGGIYAKGGNPAIRNCAFTQNGRYFDPMTLNYTTPTTLYVNGGGGLYCEGGTPLVTNCTVSGNFAGYGGGLYMNNATGLVASSLVYSHTVGGDGGGVYITGPTRLQNTMVSNNVSYTATAFYDPCGGGVYAVATSAGTPFFDGCQIVLNQAQNAASSGGGMYLSGGTPTVTNCTFLGNRSLDNGGGLSMNNATGLIVNCTAIANYAYGDGGGLYLVGPVTVVGTIASNNTADSTDYLYPSHGGGLYAAATAAGSPCLMACTVSSNRAGQVTACGGGVFLSGGTPIVSNCTISANLGEGPGGGVYVNSGTSVALQQCSVVSNTANIGGGLDVSGAALVQDCTVANNAGTNGGGIAAEANARITVSNVLFAANTGTKGGGCQFYNGSGGTIIDCAFEANATTDKGGALYGASASASVVRCSFNNNTSAAQHGSVVDWENAAGSLSMINCYADGNSGKSAFYLSQLKTALIQDCTFVSNTDASGGGLLYNYRNTNLLVRNSILWNNTIAQIVNSTNAANQAVTVDSSVVQGGYASSGSVNVITDDPLLTDGYHLLYADSPCAGTGNPTDAPAEDLDRVPRTYTDIGCGAFQGDTNSTLPSTGWLNYYFGTTNVDLASDPNYDGLTLQFDYQYHNSPLAPTDFNTFFAGGMCKLWLWDNFGRLDVDPNADPDGDGLTNVQEYLLGTDPNTANYSDPQGTVLLRVFSLLE